MSTSPLRVGLLGLGTVNTAVAQRVVQHAQLLEAHAGRPVVLRGVAVRDTARQRDIDLGEVIVTADAAALVTAETIDVIVEAIGGTDPVLPLLRAALAAGKHVVTANKEVIARHGDELGALAVKHGVALRYGAAAGAAVPMLELFDNALGGDDITSIDAICNSTTNFVLEQMGRGGLTLDQAIAEAQRLGFAEADPSTDIDGWDAAFKLALLAGHAFGGHVDVDLVRRRGIRDVTTADLQRADEMGCAIKLLAHAAWDGSRVSLSVQPTLLVRGGHPLASVDGSRNGVLVQSDLAGTTLLTGTGAGGDPTASAVVNDIVITARDGAAGWRPVPQGSLEVMSADDAECAAYVRIRSSGGAVGDEVAQMLEDRGVPVVSIMMSATDEVVVLTGTAPVSVIANAMDTIDSMPVVDRVLACLEVGGKV